MANNDNLPLVPNPGDVWELRGKQREVVSVTDVTTFGGTTNFKMTWRMPGTERVYQSSASTWFDWWAHGKRIAAGQTPRGPCK